MHDQSRDHSLARELALCEKTIGRIRKTLELLERKHGKTTERFLEEYRTGKLAGDNDAADDYAVWTSSVESLNQWQELERQCREHMKRTEC